MRTLALLLPIFALLLVAGLAATMKFATSERETAAPNTRATATATATATPEPRSARLTPGQTVCQGTLHVPQKGEPRTFPAVYTKKEEVNGFYIVAQESVDERAFAEAKKTVARVFRDPELGGPLVDQGAYIIIAARGQGVLDLPEFACLEQSLGQQFFSHVCGIADRADYPVATVNEADLLGESGGPCGGLNILYHELGHLVQGWSMPPADYFDVKLYYQDAMTAGKYRRHYASTNPNEYFAEGTQAYLLYGEPGGGKDRQWLKEYDPQLFTLLERLFGK